MGDMIDFWERTDALRGRDGDNRRRRAMRPRTRAEFYFDLGCPFTYLAVERVERAFDEVRWTPASAAAMRSGGVCSEVGGTHAVRRAAETRAPLLGLPLVWPERWPVDLVAATRVAACAADAGRGAAFVLAASRLAFCGGFHLDDPDVLAEAAAAAGLPLDDCLRAARDTGVDGAIEAAARRLLAVGVDRLPALRVGRALCWGEGCVAEAIASARIERSVARRDPAVR
jgi:2-hydroxychromene-2-carboxylate isomerase